MESQISIGQSLLLPAINEVFHTIICPGKSAVTTSIPFNNNTLSLRINEIKWDSKRRWKQPMRL